MYLFLNLKNVRTSNFLSLSKTFWARPAPHRPLTRVCPVVALAVARAAPPARRARRRAQYWGGSLLRPPPCPHRHPPHFHAAWCRRFRVAAGAPKRMVRSRGADLLNTIFHALEYS